MFYVCSAEGILKEYQKFEEAEAYIENSDDPDDMWISSDEEDDYDDVDEMGYDPYMGEYTYDC